VSQANNANAKSRPSRSADLCALRVSLIAALPRRAMRAPDRTEGTDGGRRECSSPRSSSTTPKTWSSSTSHRTSPRPARTQNLIVWHGHHRRPSLPFFLRPRAQVAAEWLVRCRSVEDDTRDICMFLLNVPPQTVDGDSTTSIRKWFALPTAGRPRPLSGLSRARREPAAGAPEQAPIGCYVASARCRSSEHRWMFWFPMRITKAVGPSRPPVVSSLEVTPAGTSMTSPQRSHW